MMLPGKNSAGFDVPLRSGHPDWRGDLGKIPLPHQRRRHGIERRRLRRRAQPFVRGHEERLVVAVVDARNHHRSLHLEAELIPLARVLGQRSVLEVAALVEVVALEILEQRSMGMFVPLLVTTLM